MIVGCAGWCCLEPTFLVFLMYLQRRDISLQEAGLCGLRIGMIFPNFQMFGILLQFSEWLKMLVRALMAFWPSEPNRNHVMLWKFNLLIAQSKQDIQCICLFIYLFIYVFVHLFIYLYVCLFIYLDLFGRRVYLYSIQCYNLF